MYKGELQPNPNRGPAIIEANSSQIPWAKAGEIRNVGLARYQDHGKSAFIASTIKGNRVLTEAADELTQDEGQRLTNSAGKIMEEILDGHPIVSTTVLTSTIQGKPDIHVATFGNPGSPMGLRLYFHIGQYERAKVLYQDARARIKNCDKVDKVFANAGYSSSRGMKTSKRVS